MDFKKMTGDSKGNVLITAGAGDIDRIVDPIQKILKD